MLATKKPSILATDMKKLSVADDKVSPRKNSFQNRVAFDTFDNKNATDFSLTLRCKHADYRYNRLTRTLLCGADDNPYSETAIQWLFEELAEDGDEIVCLRVIDPNSKLSTSDTQLEEKRYRKQANIFLEKIQKLNTKNKRVSLVLEFSVGKVQSMIQRMIQIYEPAILIVGTRGRSLEGFKGLLPGSVSKYCLQHSPVPVVVVCPSQKRQKKRAKREADPTRKAYRQVLQVYEEGYNAEDEVVKVYERGAMGKLEHPDLPAYLTTPLNNDSGTVTPNITGGRGTPVYNQSSSSLLRPGDRQKSRSPSFDGVFWKRRGRSLSPNPTGRRDEVDSRGEGKSLNDENSRGRKT